VKLKVKQVQQVSDKENQICQLKEQNNAKDQRIQELEEKLRQLMNN